MALPAQLKSARMTNATAASAVPTHTTAAEQAVADILGVTVDVDVLPPAFFKHVSNLMTVPMVKASRAAALATVASTPLLVVFDTETYDNDTMFSTSVDPTRVMCQTAGKYLVTAKVEYSNDDSVTFRRLEIVKNGQAIARVGTEGQPLQTGDAGVVLDGLTITICLSLAVGEYLEMMFTHNSVATIDIGAPTYLAAYRLGA